MAVAGVALIIGFISILLQGVLLHCGFSSYLIPQVPILLVVFLAFYEVSVVGAFLAFCLGIVMDLASAQSLGPWAGACIAVYGALVLLSQRLFIDSAPVAAAISTVCVAVVELLYCSLEPTPPRLSWGLCGGIVARALCSGICAPLLFPFLIRRVGKASSPFVARSAALTSL